MAKAVKCLTHILNYPMSRIALFYGSDLGNTEDAAQQIADQFKGIEIELFDVANTTIDVMAGYDYLILGVPTWDYGGIQIDWDDSWETLNEFSFSGKTVACFGLGDQFGYADFFQDAMGLLHDLVRDNGGKLVGYWPAEGYEFDESKALTQDGSMFVGLALDEDNQGSLTEERIEAWCQQVMKEMEIPLQ